MAKQAQPMFRRPGDLAPPANIEEFVSGRREETPTPAPAERRLRKAGAWGMPGPGEPIAKLGIDLTTDARRKFRQKALDEGKDCADLVREWIRRYVGE
jgi:hypothetical protein